MNIAINSQDFEIYTIFIRLSKSYENINILNCKVESVLFDTINDERSNAYVLFDVDKIHTKKIIDIIKNKNRYIPILCVCNNETIDGTDIYINEIDDKIKLVDNILRNTINYIRLFSDLIIVMEQNIDMIEFNMYKYDPIKRLLYENENEICKLSIKEGSLFKELIKNFNNIVNKDLILKKIWGKSDYFVGRSMDVHVTHLRNIIKENNLNMKIENVSGSGIMIKEKYKKE